MQQSLLSAFIFGILTLLPNSCRSLVQERQRRVQAPSSSNWGIREQQFIVNSGREYIRSSLITVRSSSFHPIPEEDGEKDNYDDVFLTRASEPLSWEALRSSVAGPVLNLSRKEEDNLASSPSSSGNEDDESHPDNSWKTGQEWKTTRSFLDREAGLDENALSNTLLEVCPQLFRLHSQSVIASARFMMEAFEDDACEMMIQVPQLLSFPSDDIQYGMEFLSIMMALPSVDLAKTACRKAPTLLLGSIEGGIQERVVQETLGAAGSATMTANQQIAGTTMASLREWKSQKDKKV